MLKIQILRGGAGSRSQLDKHRKKLIRLAYSWCNDSALADDLVQEALYKALKKSEQVRDTELLERWLCKIMVNCWKDYLRKDRHTEDVDDICLADNETPEREAQRVQDKARVHAAMDRLPQSQREVLTLVDLGDMSYADAAEVLEIPIGTVMSRISRGRTSLRNYLKNTGLNRCERNNLEANSVLRRVK